MQLQVDSNGIIFLRVNNNSENAVIAPFKDDTNYAQYTLGFHSYRQDTTPETLTRATDAVMGIRQYAQELPDFQATWTLIVTWHDAVLINSDSTEVSLKITLKAGQRFPFLKTGFLHNK